MFTLYSRNSSLSQRYTRNRRSSVFATAAVGAAASIAAVPAVRRILPPFGASMSCIPAKMDAAPPCRELARARIWPAAQRICQ